MKKILDKIKGFFNNPKNPKQLFFIIGCILGFVFMSIVIFMSKYDLEYSNKKLILKEPTKITAYNEFKTLCQEGKIDTVYYTEDKDTLLFTTIEDVNVKQIDYKHNELKDIYTKEIRNEIYRQNPTQYKDEVIFVYQSFNIKTDTFREYLAENNIQVVDIEEHKIEFMSVLSILIYIIFIFMISKTLNVGKSDEEEEVTGVPNVTFDDIEGNEEAKEEMKVIVDFLQNPNKYEDMGAKIPKGVILYGPPGTGKTLLAKAIAGEANVPFFNKSASDFVEIYVGVGAKRVRNLFKKARKKAPCIIFIDEIDAIGGKRGVSKNDEKDQTLNKLLIELDGFKSSERIIVIAATNRIDMLDDALTRSGRFDKHIPIYLPDKKDRVGIFKVHLKNKKLNENIKIEYLAEITSGFSGADIATLVNEAAIIACVKNHEKIELDDIDEAYVKTAMKSNPKKDVSRSLKETQIVAYHEAGHAIVAKVLDNKVHKVTIVGTTSGVGGFTSTTGNESSLLSKEDFEKEIKILLGGRAAEYLLFNKNEEKITTGASNDIERSSKIINDMITKYGMFIKSPVVIKGNQSISNSSMYVPFKITDEIKNNELFNIASVESTRLYNETITILENNKKLLDKVANYLIEKETLTETELNMLISEIENEENIKNDNL